jgi:hypothetical protein
MTDLERELEVMRASQTQARQSLDFFRGQRGIAELRVTECLVWCKGVARRIYEMEKRIASSKEEER